MCIGFKRIFYEKIFIIHCIKNSFNCTLKFKTFTQYFSQMCIISQAVKEVEATKILVAINSKTQRQFTVYSNRVDNDISTNAMILPVPNPKTVQFHDLSKHKNIFQDLDRVFKLPPSFMFSYSLSMNNFVLQNSLEVFDVGSYQVSLATSLEDILRVNQQVFQLSQGCYSLLQSTYPSSFGFIICKIKQANATYHPFAYSHQIIDANQVFVPTKHYHEHSYASIDDTEYELNDGSSNQGEGESWSHTIYLYNCTSKNTTLATMSEQCEWTKSNPLTFNYNDIAFEFGHCSMLEKHIIKGQKPNTDLMVAAC